MPPWKSGFPIFVDNKWWTCEPALWTALLVFIYVYHIDVNIERLMPRSNKLHLKTILSSNSKSKQQSPFKSKQQGMTSCRCKDNALYNLIFSYFKLFFADAINWKFAYLFLLASLE